MNAAPIPAGFKQAVVIAEDAPRSSPTPLVASELHRRSLSGSTVASAPPPSSHTIEASSDEVNDVELYPRTLIRAALRTGREAVDAAGEAAFKASDSPDVVVTSKMADARKLKAKSKVKFKRGSKPSSVKQLPTKTDAPPPIAFEVTPTLRVGAKPKDPAVMTPAELAWAEYKRASSSKWHENLDGEQLRIRKASIQRAFAKYRAKNEELIHNRSVASMRRFRARQKSLKA